MTPVTRGPTLPPCDGPCLLSGLHRTGTVWVGEDPRMASVILAFGMSVTWIGMAKADARALAQDLLRLTEPPA